MAGVKSSQVESIGHQGDTLAVKFKSGGTKTDIQATAPACEKFKGIEK
jgi:hypothetical protein